ncbi:MAG: ABC transporter substrate-binding protein [Dehalococcoidia bacterium]
MAIAAAALVGCGSGDDDDDDVQPTAQVQTPAPAPTTAAPPRSGGLFTTSAQNATSDHLDVQQSSHPGILNWSQYANDGLMILDEPVPGDLTIKPQLIESWEQPDSTTLLLKVRKGVKFANIPPANGRALTSKDIVFSLQRMATDSPKYPRRTWFTPVDSITAPDDYTVKIVTKRPYAAFLQLLAHPWTVVIDSETVKQDGDQIKHLVGTGPYIAKRVEINVEADFDKNPDYWDTGKPYLDSWKFLSIPDNAAQLAAFRSGQLDLCAPNPDVREKFKSENPGAREVIAPSVGNALVAFNIRKKPFDDPRVRQAIANAVDIPAWLEALFNGDGQRTAPMPTYYTPWALPKDALKFNKPDLKTAKELLNAAGYGDGFKMGSVTLGSVLYQGSAIQMQADLRSLNIEVDIQVQPTSIDYTNKVFVNHEFEAVNGQDFAPDDPDQLGDKFRSDSTQNWSGYSNPKVDELFTKQSQTLDHTERRAIVDDIQKTLIDDVASLWTFIVYQHTFYKSTTGNMRRSPMNGNQDRWEARNLFFSA